MISDTSPPAPTRTIGPLHLEDLEPHRFEDLVRQLLYDFRPWRDLEATGRSGSDGGFDARAFEIVSAGPALPSDGDSEREEEYGAADGDVGDRQWLIQCKREKAISPKKLLGYLTELPDVASDGLYGIVFVAACDFSKLARDAFYKATRERGFAEVKLWGKAEIEDQLFQPRNDHLLFAYFGISLQIRKRSLKTAVRARLVTKKKAKKTLRDFSNVLIRDVTDERYPHPDPDAKLPRHQRRRWKVFRCKGCHHDGVHFSLYRAFAYIDNDGVHWDVAEGMNAARVDRFSDPWHEKGPESERHELIESAAREKWEPLADKNKAWLDHTIVLPYDNILAIDEDGDEFFGYPQVYVSAFDGQAPFLSGMYIGLENIERYGTLRIDPDEATRIDFFDRPDVAEAAGRALRALHETTGPEIMTDN